MNFHDVWGAIEYKGEGVFIAGGAGVTRSLQFLGNYKLKTKSLKQTNFTNKTANDIILKNLTIC
jgi:hypothetical protein